MNNKLLRVAHVSQNEDTLILNKGRNVGVSIGDKYVIYGLSEDEILDPETGESLGRLEIIRGNGEVTYIQDSMCTVERVSTSLSNLLQRNSIPFKSPKVGDYAKLIE